MDNDFFPTPSMDAIPAENSLVSTREAEEEATRKQLSYKRTTILLCIIAVILLAFIVWEVVDLSLGGRP